MEKVKFQVEMPQNNADRLSELARQGGVTKREIINGAMTLLEWAIDEVRAGRRIVSKDPETGNPREFISPLLRDFAALGN